MKVAVIGAGPAGLISSRSLAAEGIEHDVFESSNEVGGTWVYYENFVDKHGLPISSSAYKNLTTNLPKELMLFEGLDYDVEGVSFIESDVVFNYLKKFSKKFSLEQYIKFEHLVLNVSRKENTWELVAKDLNNDSVRTYMYDAVFVCNGHFSIPSYPDIPGAGSFLGTVIHSHYYRTPETFTDKTVVIMGYGPSGVDILLDMCPYSKLIYFSHHGPECLKTQITNGKIIHKPDIKAIDGYNIHFMDDTTAQVDVILYCTGYKYGFPFLDESCGIKVDDNYVCPLYKQLVSIPHSSMFFIGIPFRSFLFQLFEIQAKCAVNIVTKKANLPEKVEMENDTLKWEKILASKGYEKKKYHLISEYVKEYFHDIANLGKIDPPPDVLFKVFETCSACRRTGLTAYKKRVYKIIDSNTFIYE